MLSQHLKNAFEFIDYCTIPQPIIGKKIKYMADVTKNNVEKPHGKELHYSQEKKR